MGRTGSKRPDRPQSWQPRAATPDGCHCIDGHNGWQAHRVQLRQRCCKWHSSRQNVWDFLDRRDHMAPWFVIFPMLTLACERAITCNTTSRTDLQLFSTRAASSAGVCSTPCRHVSPMESTIALQNPCVIAQPAHAHSSFTIRAHRMCCTWLEHIYACFAPVPRRMATPMTWRKVHLIIHIYNRLGMLEIVRQVSSHTSNPFQF